MPVTRRGNLYDNIDQTNSAAFLFRDDEPTMESNYAGIEGGDDGFPKLFTQKGNPNRVSALDHSGLPSPLRLPTKHCIHFSYSLGFGHCCLP